MLPKFDLSIAHSLTIYNDELTFEDDLGKGFTK